MDLETFENSLSAQNPPEKLSAALRALWKASKGDWEGAHNLVQDDPGQDAAWVHAYLHREEGDTFNANYWYRRAGKPTASGELSAEWRAIVKTLLS